MDVLLGLCQYDNSTYVSGERLKNGQKRNFWRMQTRAGTVSELQWIIKRQEVASALTLLSDVIRNSINSADGFVGIIVFCSCCQIFFFCFWQGSSCHRLIFHIYYYFFLSVCVFLKDRMSAWSTTFRLHQQQNCFPSRKALKKNSSWKANVMPLPFTPPDLGLLKITFSCVGCSHGTCSCSFSLQELTGSLSTCGPKFRTVNLPFFRRSQTDLGGNSW